MKLTSRADPYIQSSLRKVTSERTTWSNLEQPNERNSLHHVVCHIKLNRSPPQKRAEKWSVKKNCPPENFYPRTNFFSDCAENFCPIP